MIKKIITGGQTGVDRAALQAAGDVGIAHGGWCPPGRICETGVIPGRYLLEETPEDRSQEASHIPHSLRTEWNVRDSDATLLIFDTQLTQKDGPGSQWTLQCIGKYHKPYLQIDLSKPNLEEVSIWLESKDIQTLNIAGPRESEAPGIYENTIGFIKSLFSRQ